jgi:hypothetical protein
MSVSTPVLVKAGLLERTYTLAHNNASVGVARDLVREFVAEYGLNFDPYNALILVSELVTNAVRYAPGVYPIWLTLKFTGVGLYIEVTDDSTELPEVPSDHKVDDVGGNGVLLLLAVGVGLMVVPLGRRGKAVSVTAPLTNQPTNAVMTVEAVRAA